MRLIFFPVGAASCRDRSWLEATPTGKQSLLSIPMAQSALTGFFNVIGDCENRKVQFHS
jgi:hypothetical protein